MGTEKETLIKRIMRIINEEVFLLEIGNHEPLNIDEELGDYKVEFTDSQKRRLKYIIESIANEQGDSIYQKKLQDDLQNYLCAYSDKFFLGEQVNPEQFVKLLEEYIQDHVQGRKSQYARTGFKS